MHGDRNNRIYLIRHGQVQNYEQIPVYGSTDVELTKVGEYQMEHLAERLRLTQIQAVYSSDLKRSALGARIIGRHHDVPLTALPELREMHFGAWEGLNLEEVRSKYPDELDIRKSDLVDYAPPEGGESARQLAERVMPCIRKIMSENEGGDILLVAHGGVNRVILCHALGMDLKNIFNLRQDYGCLNIIDYFPDSTQVRLMNG
jgi:alpha-ribazole phosphatase/probable phosphoglycerate mutase